MTTTDPVAQAAALAVRAALSTQANVLAGALNRMRAAQSEMVPRGEGSWRGSAHRAQQLLVDDLARTVEAGCDALEQARQHTGAAIWSMDNAQ